MRSKIGSIIFKNGEITQCLQKNGHVKNGFKTDFVLTKRRSFSQIILFSKSKFTVNNICMSFIDFYKFKHSILGG